jgi:hypothetical protein
MGRCSNIINKRRLSKKIILKEYRNKADGYEILKAAIIDQYIIKQRESLIQSKTVTKSGIEEFISRKQNNKESIRNYGDAFMKLAKDAFPNADPATIDEFLKQTFIKGINNQELRLIALEKLNKSAIKNDKNFSIDKFINYVYSKKIARERLLQLTEKDSQRQYQNNSQQYSSSYSNEQSQNQSP